MVRDDGHQEVKGHGPRDSRSEGGLFLSPARLVVAGRELTRILIGFGG